MKRTILYSIMMSAAAFLSVSCNDWLSATPPSQIPADEHYSSVEGFQQTLTGCYIAMTEANLYGRAASWLIPELLGHQFYPYTAIYSSNQTEYYLQQYEYERTTSKTALESVWAAAYNVIVNANDALNHIEEKRDMLTVTDYSVIKGELLAIRAYVHFDLIRLYGYGNWAARKAEVDAKYAVPYVTTVTKELTPQVKMSDFFKLLTADLNEAAALLKAEDPIAGAHEWSYYDEVNSNGYYDYRNLHLNYYAVRALQARVYLWEGSAESKSLALTAAEEVINGFFESSGAAGPTNMWRWMDSGDQSQYQSMVFEQLFGIFVSDMSDLLQTYIIEEYRATDYAALYVTSDDMSAVYEDHPTDWRSQQWFHKNSLATDGYSCTKLNLKNRNNGNYNNRVPLIRIPEVYYIAAECCVTGPTPDLTKAMAYLNTVREHRSIYEPLENLGADEIMAEIAKEYRKEYPLEGVVFYLYKRLGETSLPYFDDMAGDDQYVLPYPDFEIQSGRIQ